MTDFDLKAIKEREVQDYYGSAQILLTPKERDGLVEKAKEWEQMRWALILGGHLRPDGSVCDYLATGSVCNKCGATDPAFLIVDKLKKRIEELEGALQELRDDVHEDSDFHKRLTRALEGKSDEPT